MANPFFIGLLFGLASILLTVGLSLQGVNSLAAWVFGFALFFALSGLGGLAYRTNRSNSK